MVGAKREKTEKEIYTKRYANFGRIFSVTFAPEAATATELPVREAHTVSDNWRQNEKLNWMSFLHTVFSLSLHHKEYFIFG